MNPITVTELGNYVKHIIRNDMILSNVKVCGELSSFSQTARGHCFFTIKDKESTLSCVMFRKCPDPTLLQTMGVEIVVTGAVNAYPAKSSYQLVATQIERLQVGSLYLELERRKQMLQREGLFDETKKRQIPAIPNRIGIITSPTGAAIHDLIHVIRRRSPMTAIELYPALVQGKQAASSMTEALDYFNHRDDISLVIIGRGGGSFEDLYCFNEEILVRAVAASRHPIISAVGHESDTVLTDFAADLRAPTPTAAGEYATAGAVGMKDELSQLISRLNHSINELLYDERIYLDALHEDLLRQNPIQRIEKHTDLLKELGEFLSRTVYQRLEKQEHVLALLQLRLEASNPLSILSKGYAIVQKNGSIVSDAGNTVPGDTVDVRFHHSSFSAEVIHIEEERTVGI